MAATKPEKLKVYGWTGVRREAVLGDRHPHPQTREICAAKSMAEVARTMGRTSARNLFNICETRNEREMEVALANPHIVLWRPLNIWDSEYTPAQRPTE
jgi:hypothetical protein